MTPSAPEESSMAPKRAGLVLGALIAVAAVANLGLAVANVALPSIGKHFDASQTELNLVAVGYSLGPGRLGPVLRRRRRPLRAEAPADPRDDPDGSRRLPRRVGAVDRRAVRRPRDRRPRRRHGVPDDAGPDHRALVGPGAHEVDRAVGGDRRRDLGARPALLGDPARALLVGVGVPAHPAARRDRARDGVGAGAEPRQRVDRAGRPPRRRALDRARGRTRPRDQLRRRCRTRPR